MKKVFKVLVGIFIVLFALLYISGNSYVIPGLIKIYGTGHTTAFLHDYNVFDNRTVEAADLPQEWPLHQKYNHFYSYHIFFCIMTAPCGIPCESSLATNFSVCFNAKKLVHAAIL